MALPTATTSAARLEQLLPQLFQPTAQSGDRYLKIDITPDLPALISLADVQAAASVPTHSVTPLPNLPTCLLGVMNAQNQVLCVVSLAELLQLPMAAGHRQYYSMLTVRLAPSPGVDAEASLLALTVHSIQGILRLHPEEIESPINDFAATLTPFLRGCVVQDGQPIAVLDINGIARALPTL